MAIKKLTKAEKTMMIIFVVLSCIALAVAVVIRVLEPDPNSTTALLSDGRKEQLATLAESDERVKYVYDNLDNYSVDIIEYYLRKKNPDDYTEFLYRYPELHDNTEPIVLTDEEINADMPMLYQYDLRWGYRPFGGTWQTMFAQEGCLTTSLTMAYISLRHDDKLNPYELSIEFNENDQLGIFAGTKITAIPWFCEKYGFTCEAYEDETKIQESILTDAFENNKVVLFSIRMTEDDVGSHAAVIREYKDGRYYINDPDSKERTNSSFTFSELAQMMDMVWVISDNN